MARHGLAAALFASSKYKEASDVLLDTLNVLTKGSGDVCERSEETLQMLIAVCVALEDEEQLKAISKRFSLTRAQVEAAVAPL